MSNGSNSWEVRYSHITWFENLLNTHDNVESVVRSDDILFTITRKQQKDTLKVLCLNEYTMGLTAVQLALKEFGKLDLIYIGGGWCGYTREAKEFCLQSKIGLYVTDEMSGALWKDEQSTYSKKDKDGNPISFFS